MASTPRLLSNGMSATRTVTAENENLVGSCNVPPPPTINQKKSTNVLNGFVAGSSTVSGGMGCGGANTLSPNQAKTPSTILSQKNLIENVAIDERKISMNGTNELRIEEKSISAAATVHLNNPFATNYAKAATSAYDLMLFNRGNAPTNTPPSTSIKTHRLASAAHENGRDVGTNDISSSQRASGRPKRPHSIAGVSSPMLLLTTLSGAATTTMTYSCSLGQGMSAATDFRTAQQQPQQFTHFINSSSRLSTMTTATAAVATDTAATTTNRGGSDEFSLYTPPPVSISIAQRRSHSQPRTDGNSTVGAMVQRPRSLDRNTINALAMNNSRPPPIPPSRRFSQQPSSATAAAAASPSPLLINTNPNSCSLSLMKNSPNSVQYPAIASAPSSSIMTAATSTTHHQQQRSHVAASGMRQSITFHGQLSRHTANSPGYTSGGMSFGDAVTKNEADTSSRPGVRRKVDRPVSFAYGTLRDQTYLENQLRIYSEQLRTITESVRKYSEQAKILSEMKRQQQQQQMKGHLESPQKRSNLIQSDSNIYKEQVNAAEPETPSHQLRAFLDSIRNTMKDSDTEIVDGAASVPASLPAAPSSSKSKSENNPPSKSVEAKTPSDQLRQFLDAIRSNQMPPNEQPDDLASAATRFSKFKEKMEHARSKSTPNFDKYQTSSNVSETFTQVSDNLRIMNEDLAALAAASPNKKPSIANYKLHLTNTAAPATPTTTSPMLQQACHARKFGAGAGGTVDSVLDSFSHLTQNAHSIDTVDYLRKCSEALRHTSNQLRVATMHNNTFTDSGDSSSCSTTPGSIREAVQNLLQQPRNGVQIMDDRMKLFIDILDSQSKFSQVNRIKYNIL